ncbi:hypothetical protein PHLCEN_2v7960, partial [Hermanssonia centrifuga]
MPLEEIEVPKQFRYDSKMITRHSEAIVHDNRWAILADQEVVEEGDYDLSSYTATFSAVMDTVCSSTGARVEVRDTEMKSFPRKIKKLLQRHKRYSKMLAKEVISLGGATESTTIRYRYARKAFRVARIAWQREQREKLYTRISDDFIAHDHKSVWRRVMSNVNDHKHGQAKSNGKAFAPVRKKPVNPKDDPLKGELLVNKMDILNRVTEHYRDLTEYNDDGKRDSDHWAKISLGEEEKQLLGINENLKWPEVLCAIRRMNRNTSPGMDGVHVNVLKSLVSEECMAKCKLDNPDWVRPDNVRVDLAADKLPTVPLTPLGKAIFKALEKAWEFETLPENWQEVVICNLPKPGSDPELCDGYRGISLLSVVLKVLLQIMTERLQDAAEKAELVAPEQSGFRRREEAMAQVIAIADIVRRRKLKGHSTFGVFIDFKKAYDRVPHGALYRVLDHLGVRGKFLNLVKHIYSNSTMAVRMGGITGDKFTMKRGTRQGCPLSPLLFILFINRIIKDCSSGGVRVPGLRKYKNPWQGMPGHDTEHYCEGGMYADDLLTLDRTVRGAQQTLRKIEKWARRWGMELGLPKCGVMGWITNDLDEEEFNSVQFLINAGTVPKVDRYKYLGVWFDPSLGDHRSGTSVFGGSLELHNSRFRAAEGLKAVHALRPLLLDRKCPLPIKVTLIRNLLLPLMLYGSEWTGFRQEHAAPIQRVVDMATRWAMGAGARSNSYAGFTLSTDLGIPSVVEEMAARRTRLWVKLEAGEKKMRTWLQILHDNDNINQNISEGDPLVHWNSYSWSRSGKNWIRDVWGPHDVSVWDVKVNVPDAILGTVATKYSGRSGKLNKYEFVSFLRRKKWVPEDFRIEMVDDTDFLDRRAEDEPQPLRPWAARMR